MDVITKAISANLISASLLNAVYSYLAWRKPMDYDDKTFQEALALIMKQHEIISKGLATALDQLPPKDT